MIPSPLMGEDQDEGENLGCRSKLDALRQRLRKVEEPPRSFYPNLVRKTTPNQILQGSQVCVQ
jgi:hypothetical protein